MALHSTVMILWFFVSFSQEAVLSSGKVKLIKGAHMVTSEGQWHTEFRAKWHKYFLWKKGDVRVWAWHWPECMLISHNYIRPEAALSPCLLARQWCNKHHLWFLHMILWRRLHPSLNSKSHLLSLHDNTICWRDMHTQTGEIWPKWNNS